MGAGPGVSAGPRCAVGDPGGRNDATTSGRRCDSRSRRGTRTLAVPTARRPPAASKIRARTRIRCHGRGSIGDPSRPSGPALRRTRSSAPRIGVATAAVALPVVWNLVYPRRCALASAEWASPAVSPDRDRYGSASRPSRQGHDVRVVIRGQWPDVVTSGIHQQVTVGRRVSLVAIGLEQDACAVRGPAGC
jgi:hypothetical protein